MDEKVVHAVGSTSYFIMNESLDADIFGSFGYKNAFHFSELVFISRIPLGQGFLNRQSLCQNQLPKFYSICPLKVYFPHTSVTFQRVRVPATAILRTRFNPYSAGCCSESGLP